jgi:hypothetical protein
MTIINPFYVIIDEYLSHIFSIFINKNYLFSMFLSICDNICPMFCDEIYNSMIFYEISSKNQTKQIFQNLHFFQLNTICRESIHLVCSQIPMGSIFSYSFFFLYLFTLVFFCVFYLFFVVVIFSQCLKKPSEKIKFP